MGEAGRSEGLARRLARRCPPLPRPPQGVPDAGACAAKCNESKDCQMFKVRDGRGDGRGDARPLHPIHIPIPLSLLTI